MCNKESRIIAFYLPQYHCIPENDKWWGKGFTEWTNTKKARPLFEGHYQPKTPLNHNYYNLLDEKVMEDQATLAKKYGVYGFCYYHYWFKGGKKLLERPIENMLKNRKIDIPFCLCWANENWSRRWDGGKDEVIMEQDYGKKEDWEKHFQYLKQFFEDDRYIKIDNKPVLVIYKPQLIPHLKEMLLYFRNCAKDNGFEDLVIMSQHPSWIVDKRYNYDYFDYMIKFEPFFTYTMLGKNVDLVGKKIKNILWNYINENDILLHCIDILKIIRRIFEKKNVADVSELQVKNYDEYWNYILENELTSEKMIAGAFTDWDNTARRKNGLLFKGASPDKFGKYMKMLVENNSSKDNIIFINAWNEWAEGAYLEPDEKYQYSYLEQLKKAIDEIN